MLDGYELLEKIEQLKEKNCQIYVAVTGAGTGLQNMLWQVPGSSAYLAGGICTYRQDQTEGFLGFKPDSFCSPEIALDLAFAAYLKAATNDPNVNTVGLGLTASVASETEHRGDHRIHVACITNEKVFTTDVVLHKAVGQENRERDGLTADLLGLELLLHATGVVPVDEPDDWDEPDYHECIYEGTFMCDMDLDLVKQHFMKRPFVTRYGKRQPIPVGRRMSIYPGNFNPPHEGHFANAGEDTTFQITTNPPHKAGLSIQDILNRLRHFKGRRDLMFLEGAGLYIEKARMFPGCNLVMGTDALRRMLDPKWGYDPIEMLREFQGLGAHIKVSIRDQDRVLLGTVPQDQDMVTEDGTVIIPHAFVEMFEILPKTTFAHLSSTKVREGKLTTEGVNVQ